jgi:hypothetical protein
MGKFVLASLVSPTPSITFPILSSLSRIPPLTLCCLTPPQTAPVPPTMASIWQPGREFFDPDLGVCQVLRPDAPPSSSLPRPAIALPDPTYPQVGLLYQSADGETHRSSVSEVARWVLEHSFPGALPTPATAIPTTASPPPVPLPLPPTPRVPSQPMPLVPPSPPLQVPLPFPPRATPPPLVSSPPVPLAPSTSLPPSVPRRSPRLHASRGLSVSVLPSFASATTPTPTGVSQSFPSLPASVWPLFHSCPVACVFPNTPHPGQSSFAISVCSPRVFAQFSFSGQSPLFVCFGVPFSFCVTFIFVCLGPSPFSLSV